MTTISRLIAYPTSAYAQAHTLVGVEPRRHLNQSFGKIDSLSPQFATIFNQASAAEAFGLAEIAGLGYRKALEFLIKDYCAAKCPDDAETIKRSFLGTVIRDRVSDRKIQGAAEKVAWLGNDEAHYVRKWEDHDLEDLKSLLKIVVNGIDEELEYDSLMASFDAKAAAKP